MKQSFVMYVAWAPLFENLSSEDAGEMIKAIYRYQMTGEEPDKSWALYATFMMLKGTMDKDTKTYQEKVDRAKKLKKTDAEQNQNEVETISTRNHDDIDTKSKRNQNDNEGVTSYTYTYTDTNTEKDLLVAGYFNDPELDKSFSDYVEMRMRMNAPVDFQRTQKKLYNMAKGDKKTMIAILEQSLQQGYKGLYELKEKPPDKKKNKFNQFEERDYDMAQLEQELLDKQRRISS